MFPSRARLMQAGLLAAVVAVAGCGIGGGGSTPSGGSGASSVVSPQPSLTTDLTNPMEVRSSNGVATVALAAVVNPSTGGPAVSYKGVLGMPTIRVSPGDAIDVTYVDELPASTVEPFNEVNLHFHGLSVSPDAPSDDSIDILAMPGQTIHYHIDIPANHPPGTYWYHPHPHHESNWQTYNGMTGAIIIDGLASISPATAGLPERVVMLRNLLQAPTYPEVAVRRRKGFVRGRNDAPSGICSQPFGIGGEYTTIDGREAGGPIVMAAGSKQLWHVVNSSADGYYDLSVDGETLHVVSMDGVALKQYPGAVEKDVSDIVIPPAGRADLIVTAPSHSGVAFRTTCFDTGAGGDPNPPQVLGLINLGTPSTLPAVPAPGATPRAPSFYDQPIGASIAQQRTVAFSEDDNGFYLNGTEYDPSEKPMFTVQSGTIERWTLTNSSTEVHDFHIHQVHFIVQDIDGVAQPLGWRDSVNLPTVHDDGTPSVSHVLIDFRDPLSRGIFLFHCHILEHEDGGMMHKIQVI